MKLFEVACNIIAQHEVEHVFGLMGDGNMKVIDYLSDELKIPFHTSRHEAGGIGMADGYARATGRIGVCTVTQGPGLTNAITAIVTARKANTPMVLLLGDVGAGQKGWPQDVDHEAILTSVGVPVVHAVDPNTVVDDVRRAFSMARERSAPVALNFPLHCQGLEWNAWDVDLDAPTPTEPAAQVADADEIRRVAELLMSAERPLIIGGRGALRSGSAALLALLADHVGALMATTLPAKGLFKDNPFAVGIAGSLGTNVGVGLIGRADVVLAAGAALNEFTSMKGSVFAEKATTIRLDLVTTQGANRLETTINLNGDAKATAAALLEQVRAIGAARQGFRTEAVAAELESERRTPSFQDQSGPDGMDPRAVMVALDEVLQGVERQVVTDVGHFFGFPATYLKEDPAGQYLPTIDFGAVGAGIGIAVGAAVARPDLLTLFFVGDGGLMMSLADVDTVARTNQRLVVIVMNDNAYGSEVHMLRKWEMSEEAAVFDNPDFAQVCASLGVRAVRATTIEELKALGPEIRSTQTPLVVECSITQRVIADWLAGAFKH